MELQPITPQPGNDRNPANFVGRVHITSQARELLKNGTNLLVRETLRIYVRENVRISIREDCRTSTGGGVEDLLGLVQIRYRL